MIINGKHVVYDGTNVLGSIISSMMHRTRKRLIRQATLGNAFLDWAFGSEKRQLVQYQEGTINADLIHDWLSEERIYNG